MSDINAKVPTPDIQPTEVHQKRMKQKEMQDALVRAKLSSNWNNISKTRNESVSHIKQAARMAKPKGEDTNKEDPATRAKQLQLINDAEGRKSDL